MRAGVPVEPNPALAALGGFDRACDRGVDLFRQFGDVDADLIARNPDSRASAMRHTNVAARAMFTPIGFGARAAGSIDVPPDPC